ncbi:MAG: YkgJ family cysteine cluster protein, partial [Thermodesulfovibrionales bacterium]
MSIDRKQYRADEANYPWLSLLLDAYELVDRTLEEAIREYEIRHSVSLACKMGCSSCCKTHKDIPVYPLELVGIYWYVIEKLKGNTRQILREQLKAYKGETRCPFLVDDLCSIYEMRPIACRQFNVFNKVCKEGEDPYYTRKQDVFIPPRDINDKAFSIMLPFYGISGDKEISNFIKNDLFHTFVKVLQALPWAKL